MSHVPTVLKSDKSVFDKMLPVDDNGPKGFESIKPTFRILSLYTKTNSAKVQHMKHIMILILIMLTISPTTATGPRSAVGNVSGYRCVSDCRSRGREFDPGPVPYFRGD